MDTVCNQYYGIWGFVGWKSRLASFASIRGHKIHIFRPVRGQFLAHLLHIKKLRNNNAPMNSHQVGTKSNITRIPCRGIDSDIVPRSGYICRLLSAAAAAAAPMQPLCRMTPRRTEC